MEKPRLVERCPTYSWRDTVNYLVAEKDWDRKDVWGALEWWNENIDEWGDSDYFGICVSLDEHDDSPTWVRKLLIDLDDIFGHDKNWKVNFHAG